MCDILWYVKDQVFYIWFLYKLFIELKTLIVLFFNATIFMYIITF